MFIIGHRGAAGLAPENTIFGIETAIQYKVDATECDIRVTKDNKLVLCHDETFFRIAGDSRKVSDLSLSQIQKIITKNGHKIPTLQQALKASGKTPLVIEAKSKGWANLLHEVLKSHKGAKPMVISYNHQELFAFHNLMPEIETYTNGDNHSVELIVAANKLGFSGISLYAWFYNPFVYRYAKKHGLKLITSPINRSWHIRLFHFFYPRVMITTDFPDSVKNHNKRRQNQKKRKKLIRKKQ